MGEPEGVSSLRSDSTGSEGNAQSNFRQFHRNFLTLVIKGKGT